MQTKSFLLITVWFFASLSSCYMLDKHNYFYINTSYTRQTISLSLCFQLAESTTISVESPLLVPQANHTFSALIADHKPIKFSQPYDEQVIGYNSYDEGEYWFGVKLAYNNPKGYRFLRLSMNLSQGESSYSFTFLQPLFTFPLSGLEVGPLNSLKKCGQSSLVSVIERLGQLDVTVLGPKESRLSIAENKAWGYFKQDIDANYLRFKAKALQQVTVNSQLPSQNTTCTIGKADLQSFKPFSTIKDGYSLEELLNFTKELDNQQQL